MTTSYTHENLCEVCGAQVDTLRRGRCWACYVRWADARPVGLGARCSVCVDRRHENLKMVEFQGTWLPMCHNCAGKTFQLTPMPRSIEGVKQRLCRDRRWRERRIGMKDHRIFAVDRRQAPRRADRAPDIEWLDAEELIVETRDEVDRPAESTRIATPADRAADRDTP